MSYDQNPYYSNVNGSGGGGGGFLSPFGSQASPGDGSKKTSQHSLRPLTLLAMHNAQQAHGEANWTVDGVEIGQITVVAQVAEPVDLQSTNMLFRLDDGTARMDARHWLESHENSENFVKIKEGSFVRVLGTLKQINNKRHLTAPHIRLASPKEFLFHKSEVMLVWAQMTLGPPTGQGGGLPQAVPNDGPSAYISEGGKAQQAENANYAHLPPLERAIIECIQTSPPRDEGVNIEMITKKVSLTAAVNAGQISNALDRLMDEGHVYTTIDDNHFLVS